jgi:hypothetical protein
MTEKITVTIPGPVDPDLKSWRRNLTGIDKSKKYGYAFLFDKWLEGGKEVDLELGSYLLFYDEEEKTAVVRVMKVLEDGLVKVMEATGRNWSAELRNKVAKLFEEDRSEILDKAIQIMKQLTPEERSYVNDILNDEDDIFIGSLG